MTARARPGHIKEKWRPPLVLVLGGTLIAVLGLPILGFLTLRVAVPVFGWPMALSLISAMVVLATLLLAWLLARLILRPVNDIVAWAYALRDAPPAPNDAPTRFGTREMGEMGTALLLMGQELQWRVADLSTYSSHVTHELRSPLTSLRAAAELLDGETNPETRSKLLQTIGQSTDRMDRLLTGMKSLAQAEASGHAQAHPIAIAPLAQAVAARVGLDLIVDGTPSAPLPAIQLELVLDHLLSNAAAHGAREVTLTEQKGGFKLQDDGNGVSNENAKKLFDPFFTTRRNNGGLGLGLFLVHRIIQSRGGKVTFKGNDPGAVFSFEFQAVGR